jgi:Cu2+-exporting ATPase
MKSCYHCDEPIPKGLNLTVSILGEEREMCCPGCQAVASAIVSSGSESFYQYRTEACETPEFTPQALPQNIKQELMLYDNPDVLNDISQSADKGREITLIIEGISCAACGWLIEKQLEKFEGVQQANLNLSQHRLYLSWKQESTPLSQIISRIYQLGFKAHPYSADTAQQHLEQEQRIASRRLVLAALGTMQAMMFAVPLYVGEWAGIFEKFETYFRFASLAITTPVVLYSARPFFIAFLRDIRTRHLTMDVPVSIAIGGAYIASVWSTFAGGEEVYFDSVCMFTFFLLIGRFLESRARLRTGEAGNNLTTILPRSTVKISDNQEVLIPVTQLEKGDLIRVLPGTTIPADGIIISGHSSVDESIITGEFVPVSKSTGSQVISGSLNVESPIDMEVTATGQDTQLSTIMNLLDRAATEKPKIAQMADLIAQYFVAAVLIMSVVVFTTWYFIDSDKAFWITLSVLVATCPCALSLATPTALTTATGALRKAGVLITRGHVFETLNKSSRIVFDKTGTLTLGQLTIEKTLVLKGNEQEAVKLAASLEKHSQHPIAHAFKSNELYSAQDLLASSGNGIGATINGKAYKIGKPSYACSQPIEYPDSGHWILLSENDQPLAWFLLNDQLRPHAKSAISKLQKSGLRVEMLSGDQSDQVNHVSKELALDKAQGNITPDGKLTYLSSLPESDMSIMVGDGINDVPVLAKAPISIAIGSASDLAKTHADVILVGNQLNRLPQLMQQSRKTASIIKQNLIWSLMYNGSVLPIAAMGLLPPWAAAIGMSLSSLVVVFNALRLNKLPHAIHS